MQFDFVRDVLTYIIPVVSVLLSYLLGRLQSRNVERYSAVKNRYETFYVPFISLLYAGRMDIQRFSDLSLKSRSKFFDTVFRNIQYIDEKTQAVLFIFYTAYLNYLDAEMAENDNLKSAQESLNSAFTKLTDNVLSEASRLSKVLHLPDISRAFVSCRQKPM